MKQLLLAAPLSLALLMATGSASANTGTIQFAGVINSGTCPVEIVDPISGGVGNIVPMGVAITAEFPNLGAEAKERAFSMSIKPGNGCTLTAGPAQVKFVSQNGPAGTQGDLYALRTSANSAGGIAVIIKDKRTGATVPHGVDSADFQVETTGVVMDFTAAFKSTEAMAAITPGAADADVNFTVALP